MSDQEEELEELRKRRLANMQQKMLQEPQQEDAQKQFDAKKQAVLRKILTPEARQRLANLKMVRPEFAESLELQLIQVAQQKGVSLPIDDEQLKEILRRVQPDRREIRIRRA
jgi:programmed cell death protein 5